MARAREVPGLTCDESFRTAAGKIIWTRFEELTSFREGVLSPHGTRVAREAVHDMRVASRRVRAALELFEDVFPKSQFSKMLRRIKLIADSLGAVRDLDVMIERLEGARTDHATVERLALDGIIAGLEAERLHAREDLAATLEAIEASDFPRRFSAFIARATT